MHRYIESRPPQQQGGPGGQKFSRVVQPPDKYRPDRESGLGLLESFIAVSQHVPCIFRHGINTKPAHNNRGALTHWPAMLLNTKYLTIDFRTVGN